MRRPTVIDLFCGAGGLSYGFHLKGWDTIAAVEKEPIFARTYAANFACPIFARSIEEAMTDLRKLRADIVIGGPPCQGFSNLAGNRPEDQRRRLWQEFMDVVESSECGMFLMENVPNLLASSEGKHLLERAIELGFSVESGVLLASDFGVPQNRRRAFILGSRIGKVQLPRGNGQRMSVREAFAGIPAKPMASTFSRVTTPTKTSALHFARNPTEISRRRYRLIPPGGNRFDLQRLAPELTPECWKRKTQGGTDLFGRLDWDQPARCTIRTEFFKPEKGRYLHPDEDRPITHWEAARLQTFPDDFLWVGSKIEIAIQIGNAVPPKLAEALASHLMDSMGKRVAIHASQHRRE